jgi:hypothetical protein
MEPFPEFPGLRPDISNQPSGPFRAGGRHVATHRETEYPNAMKRILPLLLLPVLSFAAGVSPDDAARAAKAWADRGYAMGKLPAGRAVSAVDAVEDPATGARLLVAKFQGGGYAVLSADDLVDPVLAFSKTGDGVDLDERNPLWFLLRRDIAAREAAAGVERGAAAPTADPGNGKGNAAARPTASQRKWADLLSPAQKMADGQGVASVSDVRVDTIVQSRWNQSTHNGYSNTGLPCYNFYTPDNDPCGCGSTAISQIMRYFQFPTAAVQARTYSCAIDGTETNLTMQGGTYDWENMPLKPFEGSVTEAQRMAIGKLTSDVGIAMNMSYTFDGSGSLLQCGYLALLEDFGYAGAEIETSGTSDMDAFKKCLIPSFDAGSPVVLGLSDHFILADGYGYSDGDWYIHLNFGWGAAYNDACDVWYAPPNFNVEAGSTVHEYNYADESLYNIFPDRAGSILSGRVVDETGAAVAGATVSLDNGHSTTTDANGIYAFVEDVSDTTGFTVTATREGAEASVEATLGRTTSATWSPGFNAGRTVRALTGSYASGNPPVCGNSYDNDIVLPRAPGRTTWRAGLLQSKWSARYVWTGDIPSNDVDRTPGVVMADVQATDSNYASVGYSNAWTGVVTYWNQSDTMFAYTGQMWMEGGKTYTFGKILDDGVRIVIDGAQVMQHQSWDQWRTDAYTPAFTGWHDIEVRLCDENGGKGPSNKNGWGNVRGLGWNTKGVTSANLTDWNWFREDGVTNRFRCLTPDVFAVVSCTKTATGFDFAVRNLSDAALPVAAYRTSSDDYAAAFSWTPAAGPVQVPAGGTAVLSVATADESPVAYQIGAAGTGVEGDWFAQFVPFGPLGYMGVSGVEGQSIAASGTVTAFGEGADSARIRVEAAAGPAFADILAASQEATISEEGGSAVLSVDGLSFGATYYLRLRIVTSSGTVYAPYAEPVTTLEAPFPPGKVYAAGLVQAQIGGSAMDRTTDILSHSTATNVPGAIMASTSGSAVNPYNGKTYSWGGNTTFGYVGQMWMEGGTTYWFGKYIDDSGDVKVDGTVVMKNDTYNAFATASYIPEKTGWHDVEFRFGNGGGGAGANSGTIGFGFNTDGISSFSVDTFKDDGPWSKAVDPGDLTLLRCVYSATPFLTVEGVVQTGDDLVVTVSCTNVPAGGGVLEALWGAGNGGYVTSAWSHAESVAPVEEGCTNAAAFTVSGAGTAAFAAFRLVASTNSPVPWVQWSEIYNLSAESPVFGLLCTLVGYTNLSFQASCSGLGAGATSVEASLQVAADPDFQNLFQTVPLAELVGIGGQSVSLTGFVTNTTYYARVVGENSRGETGASSPVIVTTLDPQPPEAAATFSGRGFTTLSATASVSTFGTGSDSATIRFEASTNGFETVFATSATVAATAGSGALLAVPGLDPATAYALRLRVENEWGLVAYVPIAGEYSTREAPLAASGIGYTVSDDRKTVGIAFGVTEVFDGATLSAQLEYGGQTFDTKTFTEAGSIEWNGIPAARGVQTAVVTVTSVVDGTTYTQTWTATIDLRTRAYAVSRLADLSNLALYVGDTVTLPEPTGADDYYAVMDIRSFGLGEDGVTLTALEPGFSAVLLMKWNAAAGAFEADPVRALALCVPEPEGNGRVFFARPGSGKMNWADTSAWRNLTDGTPDYPRLANDVAMAALPSDQLVLDASATVAELYIGEDENHLHGAIRLTGKNSATLTFRRSSGKPGLLRLTGHGRIVEPVLTNGWTELRIGGGDGNSTSTGLGIEMPGGLEFDCGAWPDYTDTTIRDSFARSRYRITDSMRHWNIPDGKTLRISNASGRKVDGDSQDGNATFCWGSGSQVTGGGTFFYDAAASILSEGMFRSFRGIVKVANKQAYDTFAPGDRGGGFKFRPESYSSASARVAEDATLLLEGDAKGSDVGASFGVVNAGHTHGYGSWGRAINAYPAKKWILDGGYVYQTHVGNNDASWREDGTTATQPVCIPNAAGTLCVSNGFTYVRLSQASDAAYPTNSLAFAALEHAGDGVLVVRSDRLFYSYNRSGWRDRTVVGGFHDHAIGGTGRAMCRHGDAAVRTNLLEATAPIVPWIVASVEADSNLYFPGADDDTDELVLAGHLGNTVLDQASDPTANVRVNGTTVALSADRTVNSLVLVNNRNAGKNLGAGRTLTITSGGLVMGNGNYKNTAYLGDESGYKNGTAGTLVFPNKAYVFVPVIRDDKNEHPEIWAKMVSPHGAVFSYPGDLHLGGDQTGIDDHIAVNGTDLRLGTATTGCEIDVPVHLHGASTRLTVGKPGSFCFQDLYFWDHGTPGATFVPPVGTQERVHKMWIDGASQPRGYYGSSESGVEDMAEKMFPAFVDDHHFSGTGWIKVMTDEVLQPTLLFLR